MGKIIEFPEHIDLLKYFGCSKSARLIYELTMDLELKLELSDYGYKAYMRGQLDDPYLTNMNRRKQLEIYKRALVIIKRKIQGGTEVTLRYSDEDGRKGYLTASDNKKYINFYMEDRDKKPALMARINQFVDGDGQYMSIRYVGETIHKEEGSLYELGVNLTGQGQPVKINMLSYDARTIAMESDIGDAYDILSDAEMPIVNVNANDNVNIYGPNLRMGLILDPDEIRRLGEQSPISPSGFSI